MKSLKFNRFLLKEYLFLLILITLSVINIIYMHYTILLDKYSLTNFAYLENILHTIAEVFSIYALFIIFIKKRYYLFFIPYFIILLISFSNVIYSKYFYTYMPLDLYTEFNNLNGISYNIYAGLDFSNIIYLFTTSIGIAYYIKYRKEFTNNSLKERLYKLIFTLSIPFITTIGLIMISTIHWSKLEYKYIHPFKNSPTESTFKFGIFYGTIIQSIISEKENFDINKLQNLKPFFASKANINKKQNKNIIIIIVESLLSFPTARSINGVEITPNLNKLTRDGAYYNNNMSSQVKLGESSDGQFIYLNGLLPQNKGITIYDYFNNKFQALPCILKKENKEIQCEMTIPTSSKTWRQDGICIKYGFDKLFSRKDYYQTNLNESWLNDKQLFEYAFFNDCKRTLPFFSVILTSSTHSPYIKEFEKNELVFPEEYSPEFKNYLSNVHYMDKHLGIYINNLKKVHLYNNSIIFIVSDHTISTSWLKCDKMNISNKIPFYIINPTVKINKPANYPMEQVDVFPTILDLLGLKSEWRGVGKSLLTPEKELNTKREIFRSKNKQTISEIIISSNYFKNQKIN